MERPKVDQHPWGAVWSPRRQHLLVHTARTEGYSKLMLGDSCTRLAVKLLTSISLGRGAQLAQDTVRMAALHFQVHRVWFLWHGMFLCRQAFSDSRYGDVISVRPMRDYSAREIAYYNHLFNVPSVFVPSLDTKVRSAVTIEAAWSCKQQIYVLQNTQVLSQEARSQIGACLRDTSNNTVQ